MKKRSRACLSLDFFVQDYATPGKGTVTIWQLRTSSGASCVLITANIFSVIERMVYGIRTLQIFFVIKEKMKNQWRYLYIELENLKNITIPSFKVLLIYFKNMGIYSLNYRSNLKSGRNLLFLFIYLSTTFTFFREKRAVQDHDVKKNTRSGSFSK